jgi:hypothetical protein
MDTGPQPTEFPEPRQLVDLLRRPCRPHTAGIEALVPAAAHGAPITTLINWAAPFDDEPRAAAAARTALRWGTAMIETHTDVAPDTATAVYCGAIRLAGYLGGHAVARHCADHPDTTGDTTLQHHITTLTSHLGHDPTTHDDQALPPLGLRLHRHLTTCRYTSPQLYPIALLARVGTADADHRAAAIGHLAHHLVRNLPEHGRMEAVREALRGAPVSF